ncbi:MAG: TolB-like translocation protein [Solirubrobacteraceae bacterium]
MLTGTLALSSVVAGALAPAASGAGDANRTACGPASESSPGFRVSLPDCRAYEMVSPPFKDGWPVAVAQGAFASDGASVVGTSFGDFAGGTGNDSACCGNAYLFNRGTDGWSTTALNPPLPQFVELTGQPEGTPSTGPGVNGQGEAWFVAHEASQSIYEADIYLRDPVGTLFVVGPMLPASAVPAAPTGTSTAFPEGEELVGGADDLSSVLFSLRSGENLPAGVTTNLWPGDGTVTGQPSLYEYRERSHSGAGTDRPQLVGTDNAGAQISPCGTRIGESPATQERGESAEGATVVFAAAPGACVGGASGPTVGQLYARIGTGGTQATVNLAGTSACTGSAECNVTAAPAFQGMSRDGSKIFFTSSQALTGSDHDATTDIYECELPGDGGVIPAPSGTVNACPSLHGVSVTGTAAGAEVQRVVAISEDGSHVYYVAGAALATAPNMFGATPVEGSNNLYVYEADGNRTAFIATLASANPVAQSTPNGSYLLFRDANDLTPDDTSTAQQIFEYATQSGTLKRISIGQQGPGEFSCSSTLSTERGFNCDGNTDSFNAEIARPNRRRIGRSASPDISDDGTRVVFTSALGLTPNALNERCVLEEAGECLKPAPNVYEYSEGQVYLISDKGDATPNQETKLTGISPTGRDIFFTTASPLVPQDPDQAPDLYDAREGGGFPAPIVPLGCDGDSCQGPLAAVMQAPQAGSEAEPAGGNLAPPPTLPARLAITPRLTRAQKLARALKACRRRSGRRRRSCEASARKRFGKRGRRKSVPKRVQPSIARKERRP